MDRYNPQDTRFMQLALSQAEVAYEKGEIPVGAVVVANGQVISMAHNTRETEHNAIAHAEILAIQKACEGLGCWRLSDCDLFVTLEPCHMCCGAIIHARLRRVVYAAKEPKTGCCGSVINLFEMPFYHRPDLVSGLLAEESTALLERFFKQLREKTP